MPGVILSRSFTSCLSSVRLKCVIGISIDIDLSFLYNRVLFIRDKNMLKSSPVGLAATLGCVRVRCELELGHRDRILRGCGDGILRCLCDSRLLCFRQLVVSVLDRILEA